MVGQMIRLGGAAVLLAGLGLPVLSCGESETTPPAATPSLAPSHSAQRTRAASPTPTQEPTAAPLTAEPTPPRDPPADPPEEPSVGLLTLVDKQRGLQQTTCLRGSWR